MTRLTICRGTPAALMIFLSGLTLAAAGCGAAVSGSAAKSEGTAGRSSGKSSGTARKKRVAAKPGSRREDSAGGGHIGEIPRDVWPELFFQDPLTVFADKRPTGAPGPASPTRPEASPSDTLPVATSQTAEAAPVAGGWSAISGEVLADETKAVKSSLTDKLQSVGKYSGSYKELRVDAATLAALAAIALQHPEAPGWKPQARQIRDVSAEIVKAATANGEKFYKPTRAAFDKLDALLSGSVPPGLEDSADTIPFHELAGRTPYMFRIERAFNYLKLNVNTEAVFRKEQSKVAHEGGVLAALAKVIATPGYDDSDLDEYQRYARELQECGLGVSEAARSQDFGAFSAALERGSKACVDCHANFKNN